MLVWDKEVKGLHVVNNASYYLYYRLKGGSQRRGKLGSVDVLTLAQARDVARKMLAKVLLGGDPFGEQKRPLRNPSVAFVFEELFTEHYSKERFQSSRYAKEVLLNWKNHLEKPFGAKKIDAVDAPAIRAWHMKYVTTPYAGNRSKAVLSKIFSHAEMVGYLRPGSNPCTAVPNHPERERSRYATSEEIARVGDLLREAERTHPNEVAFLYALIYSGSRPSLLERVRGCHCTPVDDFVLIWAPGKSGLEKLFIPKWVTDLLRDAPSKGGYVFGKFPRAFWNEIRVKAGCPDLWARDWRRTFGTMALSHGVTRGAVGELLNHKSEQTTKRYSHLTPEARVDNARKIWGELEKRLKPQALGSHS